MSGHLMAASGFAGLENSPLARIGYYNKIITKGWERDFLSLLTNTEIDGRLFQCNQMIQFTKQPTTGPWRRDYEKNQELILDQVSPEAFSMVCYESAYKAIKFDKLDVKRICERWAEFERGFIDDMYHTLSEMWHAYVLNTMVLGAAARDKGNGAGRGGNVNLGAPGAPTLITGANIASELAKLKRVLMENRRWKEGEMFIVVPPAILEQFVTSPFANALQMGDCVDCSLLATGEIPNKIMGFTVIQTDQVPSVIDTGTNKEAYFIIAGHRMATAFVGDIVEADIAPVSNSFGHAYRVLTVWGSQVIYPDALAIGYWTI
jgi:hypothetical protein